MTPLTKSDHICVYSGKLAHAITLLEQPSAIKWQSTKTISSKRNSYKTITVFQFTGIWYKMQSAHHSENQMKYQMSHAWTTPGNFLNSNRGGITSRRNWYRRHPSYFHMPAVSRQSWRGFSHHVLKLLKDDSISPTSHHLRDPFLNWNHFHHHEPSSPNSNLKWFHLDPVVPNDSCLHPDVKIKTWLELNMMRNDRFPENEPLNVPKWRIK